MLFFFGRVLAEKARSNNAPKKNKKRHKKSNPMAAKTMGKNIPELLCLTWFWPCMAMCLGGGGGKTSPKKYLKNLTQGDPD